MGENVVDQLHARQQVLKVIQLDNREASTVSNVALTLTASSGLTYQSVASPIGTVCNACVPGSPQWRLTLPGLAAGATQLVTFTRQLAANLSAQPIVTSTLTAGAGSIKLGSAALAQLTDGVPPTVTLVTNVPATLKIGTNTLNGLAGDSGIGVQKVEILPQGSAQWQTVTGTLAWQAAVNMPNVSTFAVQVRATDFYNQISPIQNYTFAVDNVGPLVTMTLPSYLTSTLAQIGGTTSDPFPAGGLVSKVEVQIGDGAAAWLSAGGPYSPMQGSQGWNLSWSTPISDGVPIQIRTHATDAAGNVTVGPWQATTIDVVAPLITVTTYTPNIIPGNYGTPARSSAPVLSGNVSDGSGLDQMWAMVYAPDGVAYTDTVSRTNASWSYVPYLHNGVGRFFISIVAADQAGNYRLVGPYVLNPLRVYLPLIRR